MILNKENQVGTIIPDNSKTGLVDTMNVLTPGTIKEINVNVNISHPFIGDLQVILIAPNGSTFTLHNRLGGKTQDLNKTFGADTLKKLVGEKVNGKWALQVKDFAPRDQGKLNSWGIDVVYSKQPSKTEIYVKSDRNDVLKSVQDCKFSGRVTDIKASVDVSHSTISDLIITLIAPSGKSVVLHNRDGKGQSNLKKTYYAKETLADMIDEKIQGKWALHVKDSAGKVQGKLKKWKVEFKYREVDNLKKVEGIGPKIEELLNNAGIFSFSRLSVTSPGYIKQVLIAGGDRFKMHDPKTWPEQSKMAAEGRWEELKTWQDQLDGGK